MVFGLWPIRRVQTMLSVVFFEDSRQRLSSFVARGHVELPEASSDEYSLVCAAVSAVLQAARAGLEEHARVPLEVRMERGDMRVTWPEAARDDASVQAIVATARIAVEQIARQYPVHVTSDRQTG
jgi:uncharacterized protein YsxB (DUF464 family)